MKPIARLGQSKKHNRYRAVTRASFVAIVLLGGAAIFNAAAAQSQLDLSTLPAETKNALRNGNEALDRKDFVAADKWLRPVAEQGNVTAQALLGFMYAGAFDAPTNYPVAVMWLRRAADQGSAPAEKMLATIYASGEEGVPKDDAQAVVLMRKAADQGDADAQTNLGKRYLHGYGVPKDRQQALTLLSAAAAKNNAEAEVALASMYLDKRGLPLDNSKVLFWLRKAADRGDAVAEGLLGSYYLNGYAGLAKDYAQARTFFSRAAQQGDGDSQFALGLMYYGGAGVKIDYVEAEKWFRLASAQGNAKAKQYIADIEQKKGNEARAVPPALQYKCLLQAFDPKVAGAGGNTNGVEGLSRAASDPRYKACIDEFYTKYHLRRP